MLSRFVYYLYPRREEKIHNFLLGTQRVLPNWLKISPCRQSHHIMGNIKKYLKLKKKNTVADGIENLSMNDVFRDFCAQKF